VSDFAQQGVICTLQRLRGSHDRQVEAEVRELARHQPVALVLPCHGSDAAGSGLGRIVEELERADFIEQVVVSSNGASADEMAALRGRFKNVPQRTFFLWNDEPELRAHYAALDVAMKERAGKGFNVWAAIGLLAIDGCAKTVALQDSDVTSFRRETLARLCFAALHPQLGYSFCKLYYSRVTDRLYGRVQRLFLVPLLRALVRLTGHQPLPAFLLSFRYPLAGECALSMELATSMPLADGWSLEIGMLGEVFRRLESRDVCQVDGGSDYDHKHQTLRDAATGGLLRMAKEIAATLLRELKREGLLTGPSFQSALRDAYDREAIEALRRSEQLALINGLLFDATDEAACASAFSGALGEALEARPAPNRELPPLKAVLADRPEWARQFHAMALRGDAMAGS